MKKRAPVVSKVLITVYAALTAWTAAVAALSMIGPGDLPAQSADGAAARWLVVFPGAVILAVAVFSRGRAPLYGAGLIVTAAGGIFACIGAAFGFSAASAAVIVSLAVAAFVLLVPAAVHYFRRGGAVSGAAKTVLAIVFTVLSSASFVTVLSSLDRDAMIHPTFESGIVVLIFSCGVIRAILLGLATAFYTVKKD